MTNYNDGDWHGWNGGECPVHPKTIVRAVFGDKAQRCGGDLSGEWIERQAGEFLPICWRERIEAFRVVKEYREPRDFWLVHVPGDVTEFTLHHSHDAAFLEQREEGGRILHVREVL